MAKVMSVQLNPLQMDKRQQLQQAAELVPYTEFFSWGSDAYGQLALANAEDDRAQSYTPTSFSFEAKSLSFDIIIRQLSCGDFHASFISGDGFLFSVGRNSEGQLGVNDHMLQRSSAPLLVEGLPIGPHSSKELIKISCGGNHSMVLLSSGELYSWGEGKFGAIGQGTLQNAFAPAPVKTNEYTQPVFSYVSCGKRHSIAIDKEGRVYGSGDNSYGQLGVVRSDKVKIMERNPEFKAKAQKAATGKEHTLLLTEEGNLYAAGNNIQGNLGLGHLYSSDSFLPVQGTDGLLFTQISAGRHSAAITTDNKLYVWGPVFLNESPLQTPQELRSNKLIRVVSIGEKTSVILDEDFHVYTWGIDNNLGQLGRKDPNKFTQQEIQLPQLVESLENKKVTQISVGLDFVLALGQDFDQNGMTLNYTYQQELMSTSAISGYQSNLIHPVKVATYDDYSKSKLPSDKDMLQQSQFISKPPIASRDSLPTASIKPFDRPTHRFPPDANDSRLSYGSSRDPPTNPSLPKPTSSTSSNADLYRQLDLLRDENFQLKQKHRQHQQSLSELKLQNEMLIENAETEMQKVNQFIDKFISEVETTRKAKEAEFENRIKSEQDKNEELKRKFHKEQNEIEAKLDKLQSEIMELRQENIQLNSAKQSAQNKISEMQRENESLKGQIKVVKEQQSYNIQSPIGQRTPVINAARRGDEEYQDRTPKVLSNHQNKVTSQYSSTHKYDREYSRNEPYAPRGQTNSRDRSELEDRIMQYPKLNALNRMPTTDSKQLFDRSLRPSSYINDGRTDILPSQSSQEQQLQQAYSTTSNLEFRNHASTNQEVPSSVFHRSLGTTNYDVHKKYSFDRQQTELTSPQQLNNSQRDQSIPRPSITHNENRNHRVQHSRQESINIGGSQQDSQERLTINDVKNRLINMQKNKEELEQKLKNYEAKLKQHYKLDK